MMELESSPLLAEDKKLYGGVVPSHASSYCTTLRSCFRGFSVGMAALIVGAATVCLAWASAGVAPGPPLFDDVNYTRSEMEAVFNLLVTKKQSYRLDCNSITYSYCGRAQCQRSGKDGIAVCGCKLVPNQVGRFQIDLASAVLMRSSSFRQGALQASAGYLDSAAAVVCSALLDGSMWSEAGFATNSGSIFHPGAPLGDLLLEEEEGIATSSGVSDARGITSQRELSSGSSSGSSSGASSSRGLHSTCMGAPCLSHLAWNATAGCSVTCLCPDYRNPDDDTTSDGCFENGALDTADYRAIMWASSLDAVLGYASNLADALKALDVGELKTEGTCNACTVV